MNSNYDNCEITESNDDNIQFSKVNTTDNIFGIIINVKGLSRQRAEIKIWDLMEKYNIYDDCEFIFFPSSTQESQIVNITNSKKIIKMI